MLYDSSKPFDREKAITRFDYLISNSKKFELTEKQPIRTLKQNRYLHLILSYFALEYGTPMEYVKVNFFKLQCNKELFVYEYLNRKTGELIEMVRSTADLDSAQMTTAIERFRNYSSSEAGIYLPEPKDLNHLEEIELLIAQNKQFL